MYTLYNIWFFLKCDLVSYLVTAEHLQTQPQHHTDQSINQIIRQKSICWTPPDNQTNNQTNNHTSNQTSNQPAQQLDVYSVSQPVSQLTNETGWQRVNKSISEWVNESISQWVNSQWVSESVSQWVSESVSQWVSGSMSQ